jgi:hypothetical protein
LQKAIDPTTWNAVDLRFVKIAGSLSRTSTPALVIRLENPIYQEIARLRLLASVLIAQAISAAANSGTYKVRLENGVDEDYLLEVPSVITPKKLNLSE